MIRGRRDRDGGHDGRARARAETASADADLVELRLDGVRDVDVAGALAGRRAAGHRHVPAGVGRRTIRRQRGRAAAAARPTRCTSAPSSSTSNGRPIGGRSDTHARNDGARALASRFRRCPGRPRGPRARDAGGARDIVKVAVTARRLATASTLERAVDGPDGARRDRDGRGRAAHARVAGVVRIVLDLRRRPRRPGRVPARDLIDVLSRAHDDGDDDGVWHRGLAARPLGVAGDAQRGVCGAGIRRRVRAVRDRAMQRSSWRVADAIGVARRERHRAAQADAAARRASRWTICRAEIGAFNTLRRGPAGWEGRNFDVAGFLAPLDGGQ